jgi:hypothetical protein
VIAVFAAIMFSGCTTAPATIDTSPGAEVSFDGLHKVKGGRMAEAWARADFDVSSYSKVMVQGAGVEFRPGGWPGRSRDIGPGGHYAVSDSTKVMFREQMAEAFMAELSKSEHFTIVTEPGPDVLLIRASLIDVISKVPREQNPRQETLLSEIGQATLVLEIRDSVSEGILYRATDRQTAKREGMALSASSTVTNVMQVRRVAEGWAIIIREGLERFMAPEEAAAE